MLLKFSFSRTQSKIGFALLFFYCANIQFFLKPFFPSFPIKKLNRSLIKIIAEN